MIIGGSRQKTVIRAGAVKDAAGAFYRPGAIVVHHPFDQPIVGGTIVRVCGTGELSSNDLDDAQILDRPDMLVVPAFANSHVHLDLGAIGRRPYGGDFNQWVGGVMRDRPRSDHDIRAAYMDAYVDCISSGTGCVGDIVGITPSDPSGIPPHGSWIRGVAFKEMFGHVGSRDEFRIEAAAGIEAMERCLQGKGGGILPGLQPHAPYSAGLGLYHGAVDAVESLNRVEHGSLTRLSTHLAETMNEDQFVRHASGPFVDLLKRLGKWDGSFKPTGKSPVEYLEPVLARAKWLVAHCNYVSDSDIAILAKHGVTVAYCPVASDYFGHAGHRYRDMMAAGVNVCLGTDSILCQPPDETQPMSILAQARHLYRRDQADPELLLKMATVNGHRGLRTGSWAGTLAEGEPALFAGIRFDRDDPSDPWIQALRDRQDVVRLA